MSPGVPLILSAEPVRRLGFRPPPPQPWTATVYARADGTLVAETGKRLPLSYSAALSMRMRYEVDLSDHQRVAHLVSSPLPARGGVDTFETVLTVGFRVTDPVEIVRRNVRDALPLVYGHLNVECARITRQFSVEEAAQAEQAVNERLREPIDLAAGITIYRSHVQLRPDAAAAGRLRRLRETRLASELRQATHELEVADTIRASELDLMRQTAELRRRELEREALVGRPLDARDLISMHLERHPEDSATAVQAFLEIARTEVGTQESRQQRHFELVKFMAELNLLQAVDLDPIREQLTQQMGQLSAPERMPPDSGWDDPLPIEFDSPSPLGSGSTSAPPVAMPVYLAIDLSTDLGAVAAEIRSDPAAVVRRLTTASGPLAPPLHLTVVGSPGEAGAFVSLRRPARMPTTGQSGAEATSDQFAGVFGWLAAHLPGDVSALKEQGLRVIRPQVYVLVGGPAPDDAEAAAELEEFLALRQRRDAPTVIACGVGDGAAQTALHVASNPDLAFRSDAPPPIAAAGFLAFVGEQVSRAETALHEGDQVAMTAPAGFRPVADEIASPPKEN